jgi:hypothetical protein
MKLRTGISGNIMKLRGREEEEEEGYNEEK